jgi:hypothetical protein
LLAGRYSISAALVVILPQLPPQPPQQQLRVALDDMPGRADTRLPRLLEGAVDLVLQHSVDILFVVGVADVLVWAKSKTVVVGRIGAVAPAVGSSRTDLKAAGRLMGDAEVVGMEGCRLHSGASAAGAALE